MPRPTQFVLGLCLLSAPLVASAQEGETQSGDDARSAEEAAEAQRIIDLNADYASAVRRAQGGDVSGALERFKAVAEQDAYWADAFYNVGSLSEAAGEFQDCALYYRRYLILEPEDEEADEIRRSIARCEEQIVPGATIHVTSTVPERVRVAIDGLPMDQGSLGPIRVAPGTYTLSASALDYHDYSQQLEVAADQVFETTIELEAIPQYGSVSFDVVQEGARVLIDGEEVGVTPLDGPIRLEVGTYHVEIVKDGYHPWRRNLDILRDLDDFVDVRLIDESVDLSRYRQ